MAQIAKNGRRRKDNAPVISRVHVRNVHGNIRTIAALAASVQHEPEVGSCFPIIRFVNLETKKYGSRFKFAIHTSCI